MAQRLYDDDTTIDDKLSCDQFEIACSCGHKAGVTWGLWSPALKAKALRQLRSRMMCKRCGKRSPTLLFTGYSDGGRMRTVWRYPAG